MKARPKTLQETHDHAQAGNDIHRRVEHLGAVLAETLGVVLSEIPGRGVGPQMLANAIGITVATASRLLKALSQDRPVAVLQLLPGPNPLRRIVTSAREKGVSERAASAALETIEEFDRLIRTEAGDRSAFKAMLSAWLPEERREFEAARRQSIFKAMCEIDGVSSDLELNCIVLKPGKAEGQLDLIDIKALLGIDRIRPDAILKLGTQALHTSMSEAEMAVAGEGRQPRNLAGELALDGLHSVRMDEFCSARPAPLAVDTFGSHVQYTLGPTGFGPSSTVDLVLVEVNRDELPVREPREGWSRPYFFQVPEVAVRQSVFDLVIHRDVYPDCNVELIGFDTAGRGPASVNDETRALDRRKVYEEITPLGSGLQRMRLLEFPRYTELVRQVMDKLDCDSDEFRAYRVKIPYPLSGTQITLALDRPK